MHTSIKANAILLGFIGNAAVNSFETVCDIGLGLIIIHNIDIDIDIDQTFSASADKTLAINFRKILQSFL